MFQTDVFLHMAVPVQCPCLLCYGWPQLMASAVCHQVQKGLESGGHGRCASLVWAHCSLIASMYTCYNVLMPCTWMQVFCQRLEKATGQTVSKTGPIFDVEFTADCVELEVPGPPSGWKLKCPIYPAVSVDSIIIFVIYL